MAETNVTLVEVSGQYIAVIYDDVMPAYVTVGDGKNYTSNITNVSRSRLQQFIAEQQRVVQYKV